jgi:hypothetical protein
VKGLLATPEGRRALLGDHAPDDVQLIPGHAIRERREITVTVKGKQVKRVLELQFSDGLVVRKTPQGYEVVAVIEAKSGHFSGASLAEKHARADPTGRLPLGDLERLPLGDPTERLQYSVDLFLKAQHGEDFDPEVTPVPPWRQIYRENRDAIDAIERQLPTTEPGQAVLDIERLDGAFVENGTPVKLLGGRASTRVLGVVPADVAASGLEQRVTADGVKFEGRREDQITVAQNESLAKAIIELPTVKATAAAKGR